MRSAFFIFALVVVIATAEKYAMVFGTKDGWSNYSIASEPCRVYSDLIFAGFKPENIILMTYDSQLDSIQNHFPGMIFTDSADNTDGDWAKYGCFKHKDYTGKDINGEVFLAILSGDAAKVTELTGKENPKVLAATEEDTVITYFIDHGDDGIVIVGEDYVTDEQLLTAIKTAKDKKLYGKWLFYMEACHSGSMFEKLPADWNIYVMTSSDAHHNANMSNCPPNERVEDKPFGVCLSGLWDNSWTSYLEANPKATVGELFDAVKEDVAKTSDQNVSEFGNMSFRNMKVADFFGEIPARRFRAPKAAKGTQVPLDQVPLHLAKWKAIRADKYEAKKVMAEYEKLAFEAAKREVEVMRLGAALMNEKAADKALKTSATTYSASCARELAQSLVKKCGHEFPLSESTTNMLRNICQPGLTMPSINWADICM